MIAKIVSVVFQDSDHRYGDKEAIVTLEDRSKEFLFAWFSDELSFREEELLGLSIAQARDLKEKRDMDYLRTP